MKGIDATGGALAAGGLRPATLERAQRMVEEAPRQAEAFEATLRTAEGSEVAGSGGVPGADAGRTDATADPGTPGVSDPVASTPEAEAARPGLGQELLQRVESGQQRLGEILGQLDSGRTFSPREMLSLQAEMHQIMRQLETTTKAMGQVVSGAKSIFQQQI